MRNCLFVAGFLVILIFSLNGFSQESSKETEIPAVIKSPSSAGEVHFPHQEHVEEHEMECSECHHEINAAKLDFPHKEYFDDFWIDCKICHHDDESIVLEAQACSKCHHTVPESIADETLSAKVAIHKNCWECHETETGAEASKSCKLCHVGPREKFPQYTFAQ